ncbi:MAG: HAD-IIIA family hydrolase [Desulfovibrio sp.]|jgi:D-glycero-D-manno-heptose 1,7-bisphosphate phosphatase|nr:HAD-IIIA family hydrolase [Desulfovibrio sp.]
MQCVILAGGIGSRLGNLVRDTPKPMLDIAGEPFIVLLIREIARFGFSHFLLLAGYKSQSISDYFEHTDVDIPAGISVQVVVEPNILGTGGALRGAAEYVEDEFLLCNGDSLCLFNILSFAQPFGVSGFLGRIALMFIEHNTRYGEVLLEGNRVLGFAERSRGKVAGHMNMGVYYMHRGLLEAIPPGKSSLEKDVFPKLAAAGVLEAYPVKPDFFIDIGIPEDLEKARAAIPEALKRPAVFFAGDCVVNQGYGHVHDVSDLPWILGARASILACNDAGYYVFVVTGRASVAERLYEETAMHELHARMQSDLRMIGAHVDAFASCPCHTEALAPELRYACECRKPESAMLLRLIADWNIKRNSSFLIGAKVSDPQTAGDVGIHGHFFTGGNLLDTLLPCLSIYGHGTTA